MQKETSIYKSEAQMTILYCHPTWQDELWHQWCSRSGKIQVDVTE